MVVVVGCVCCCDLYCAFASVLFCSVVVCCAISLFVLVGVGLCVCGLGLV